MDVEEKSQVLSKRLKLSIFGTFHSLLQMAAFPFWQAAVFMTIEFVQYLFFNFYPSVTLRRTAV
ncbi:MAG: hypothetical protein P4M11_04365 [Candidatus Pacebacteria bacterium]|nr:hypothetical protein [Candidatus Paceibacterota bacterium]